MIWALKRTLIILSIILMITFTLFLAGYKSYRDELHLLCSFMAVINGLVLIGIFLDARPVPSEIGFISLLLVFEVVLIFGIIYTKEPKLIREPKSVNLEQRFKNKLSDITDLRSDLKKKRRQIISLKKDYQNEIRKLEKEILTEKGKNRIITYEQAIKNQTIAYDLSLISKLKTYIQKIDELVPQIAAGVNELSYLRRDAMTDLKMIETLGDQEAEKLMRGINKTVDEYLPISGKFIIRIDERKLEPLKKIWDEIARKGR